MNRFLQKILLFLAACAVSGQLFVSLAAGDSWSSSEPLRRDDGFIYGTLNYPVTICGYVEAVAKEKSDHRFLLKNGSLLVSLQIGLGADQYSRQQFSDLKSIFPTAAQGCVHGRQLPVTTNGVTTFDVERTSLAIVLGGISVSN